MKQKKNLHAIVKYFYPVAAGIETNMLETYSVLAKKGWNVTIHTSNVDYTTDEILPAKEMIKGIKTVRYDLGKIGFSPGFNIDKADVIALHNFNVLPHFWIMFKTLFQKLLGKKTYSLVLTPHGGFNPEWSIFPWPVALIKSLYHYTLGTLLINSAVDGIRAVSEWEKQEMIKKGVKEKKIKVISNGIENEAFKDIEGKASGEIKQKVKELGRYIIQIGRIYPIKNYETAIKSMKYIPGELRLVIVGPIGSKKYKKELEKLIKALELVDRVVFFGVVRGIDKFYLIKQAEVMVHMAIWESFCNVVHEGMSQGLPVIVANNTALPFLVKDRVNGFLVDTKDHKKVAEKINYILKNKNSEEIKRMSKTNIDSGKEHAWSKVAENMDVWYMSLLNH